MQDQRRVVIDYVSPSVNGGEFYIKRVVNEIVNVNAHILADGHDVLGASVLYKHEKEKKWRETRMNLVVNNEWESSFVVEKQGYYTYKVEAWVDYALNWQHGIKRKIDDNQHVNSELLEGIAYLKTIKKETEENDSFYLDHLINIFAMAEHYDEAIREATSERLHSIFTEHPEKSKGKMKTARYMGGFFMMHKSTIPSLSVAVGPILALNPNWLETDGVTWFPIFPGGQPSSAKPKTSG